MREAICTIQNGCLRGPFERDSLTTRLVLSCRIQRILGLCLSFYSYSCVIIDLADCTERMHPNRLSASMCTR